METQDRNKGDDQRGLLIAGLIVLGVGVFFLLEQFGLIPDVGQLWPIFPIIVGLALIIGSFRRRTPPPTP
jgi:hypothetical protein